MTAPILLCASDLRQSGEDAARLAAHLGRRLGASLELVHVMDVPTASELGMAGLDSHVSAAADTLRRRAEGRRQEAEQRLAALAAECATQCPTRFQILTGRPWEAIVHRADEVDAELVVVGSHVRADSWLKDVGERLLGTTADRVLRHARRPVLVAAGDVMKALEGLETSPRVVVGHELAAGGDAALTLLSKLYGAKEQITVVHVLEDPFSPDDAPLDWPSLRQQWASEIEARLRHAAERVGAPTSCVVVAGPPAGALLAEATERDAHLLALGAHAGGRLSRVLLGSTAERVIRRASLPVLVVPPRETAA